MFSAKSYFFLNIGDIKSMTIQFMELIQTPTRFNHLIVQYARLELAFNSAYCQFERYRV